MTAILISFPIKFSFNRVVIPAVDIEVVRETSVCLFIAVTRRISITFTGSQIEQKIMRKFPILQSITLLALFCACTYAANIILKYFCRGKSRFWGWFLVVFLSWSWHSGSKRGEREERRNRRLSKVQKQSNELYLRRQATIEISQAYSRATDKFHQNLLTLPTPVK